MGGAATAHGLITGIDLNRLEDEQKSNGKCLRQEKVKEAG